MSRRAWAKVNLAALRHNLQVAREAAPSSRILAIIKANGYGHGMIEVAQALHQADGFGVACLEEAIKLREAGIQKPILLLEGPFSATELSVISQYRLSIIVHQTQQVEWLERWQGTPISVWLKLDSGMHRLGFSNKDFPLALQRLKSAQMVADEICLMTHFANADDPEHPMNQQQISLFDVVCDEQAPRSLANSAALLAMSQTHGDWVRPGIMLYGSNPFVEGEAADWQLKPVMTLYARLIAIKQLKEGDAIGYGSSWQCPEDMPIGVVSIGYGDGYPRHAGSGTPVLINGIECPIVGRVSMDMICVDLRNAPQAALDSEVRLWGEGLPIERIADAAETIAYELLCGVTARVDFEYCEEPLDG